MGLKKRSVSIRGHRTSFSLETEFWAELKLIAQRNGISLAQLVTRIDANRNADENLSSALRLYIFGDLKSRIEIAERSDA